ncbi:MAG TPA: hypothetical protein PLI18_06895 [Pirellulaceae bacterium]|nr:hypothetical protein [Pirellulaceae bacterium]
MARIDRRIEAPDFLWKCRVFLNRQRFACHVQNAQNASVRFHVFADMVYAAEVSQSNENSEASNLSGSP